MHRLFGRVWVVLMLVTATSGLFINEIRLVGLFSPIHLLSLVTYVSLFYGLRAIIVDRDVRRHRLLSLLLAGAFTLLPGRRMHAVLFGADAGWLPAAIGMGIVLSIAAALFLWIQLRERRIQARSQNAASAA
jgi:hypothetical protein